jgi:hypothetical protein
MPYDAKSTDSMFSRILERLDTQDATLGRIEIAVDKTNGRVTALEKWRYVVAGGIVVVVTIVGWFVTNR